MLTRKQYDLLLFINSRIQSSGVSPSFDEMKDALALKSKSGIHRLITALEERGYIRRLPHRARALEVVRLPENLGGKAAPRDDLEGAGLDGAGLEGAGLEGGGFEGTGLDGRGEAEIAAEWDDGGAGDQPPARRPAGNGRRLSVVSGAKSAPVVGGRRRIDADRQGGEARRAESDTVAVPLIGRIAAGAPIEALQSGHNSVEAPSMMIASGGEHFALEVKGDSMIEAGILDGDVVVIRRQATATNGDIVVALVDENEATLKRLRRRGGVVALEAANPAYETRVYGADQVRVQGRLVGLLRSY